MNTAEWLGRAARDHGDNPALIHGVDPVCDYAGFWRRATGFAGWLVAQGITPGDRVLIFARNHPDYLIAQWGTWIAGAAVVPINAMLHGVEAAWIAQNAGARLAVVAQDLGASLAQHATLPVLDVGSGAMQDAQAHTPAPLVSRAPGDLAWLFYTSGTTGRPKGVQITHGMISALSLGYLADVDSVSGLDAIYYGGPMSHGAGLYGPVHVLKGAAHIAPSSGGFDPGTVLSETAAHGSASMFLAPTMVRRLTRQAREMGDTGPGIRTIVYGGGPMYLADLAEALDQFGPKFVQIYGQGECPMAITALGRHKVSDRTAANWETLAGGVGRAQSLVQVQVFAPDGTPRAPGEVGEIVVRGLPVMPGYWQNESASAEALRNGWLWTGDLGALDEDGYLTLIDRSKDLIISGGSNIYPREVEEVIAKHPDIAEVSVVARPDPEWGEIVVAFIVAQPGVTIDVANLDAHCNAHMGRYKRPKSWVQVAALPKNNYGKVLKTELRARLGIG